MINFLVNNWISIISIIISIFTFIRLLKLEQSKIEYINYESFYIKSDNTNALYVYGNFTNKSKLPNSIIKIELFSNNELIGDMPYLKLDVYPYKEKLNVTLPINLNPYSSIVGFIAIKSIYLETDNVTFSNHDKLMNIKKEDNLYLKIHTARTVSKHKITPNFDMDFFELSNKFGLYKND
ncbi:hypothetical protein [Staphylococcus epidermidis]|uniref:hypothetical protein n=1 Tax=Staphylococcus epidermidis TaxID=1282 RepID=UPI000736AF73|nr:hypothetical protein [Staphylococcus epidermidis]KTT61382.1 hypothetical protein SB7C_05475 [Staphylococcus epidermidis]KTT80952.1 hypothetical protein SA6_05745 [Staphylococcus epidermidis]KTW04506.1 hypothetical protein SA8_00135 [Staphylococcus epidermidis]KTW05301.1 hypothetical protein SB7B_08960 [Staphylococcus epidermidis]MDH8770497.1 hypothetical protein [Staphylococcus epidermidis]